MLQNIYVLQDGATNKALTELTRDLVAAPPGASAVIQSAIDALAETGGAITIGRGSFPIAEPIRLSGQVWLPGGGRGTRLVVEPSNETGIGLLGTGAHGVVVSDLAVRPAESQGGGCSLARAAFAAQRQHRARRAAVQRYAAGRLRAA
jgi:hypothetical protein